MEMGPISHLGGLIPIHMSKFTPINSYLLQDSFHRWKKNYPKYDTFSR